jgi:hypothetical protein
MEGVTLGTTETKRDIGVLINNSLKPSAQCTEAARRANCILGQIARSFHYRNRQTFIQLYKQYVRPHLEFAVQVWSPWSNHDVNLLENVQKRAVRMVSGLISTTYEGRLSELNLMSLEKRRLKYDMVQTFKIIRGFDKVDYRVWFTLVGDSQERRTRGTQDPLNIVKPRCRSDIRQHFFSHRVVDFWNRLPSDIKSARSVSVFKNMINEYIINN